MRCAGREVVTVCIYREKAPGREMRQVSASFLHRRDSNGKFLRKLASFGLVDLVFQPGQAN